MSQPSLLTSMSLLTFGPIQYTLNVEWTLIYEVFFYLVCSVFAIRTWKKAFLPFLIVWGAGIAVVFYVYDIPTVFLPTIQQIPFSLHFGWAIDPYTMEPAADIVLVCDGHVIPIEEITWKAREGLVKVLNAPGVLESGWELTFNTKYLDVGNRELILYSVSSEGKYMRLNSNVGVIHISS